MQIIVDVTLLALAVTAVCDIWFFGELFDYWRGRFEMTAARTEELKAANGGLNWLDKFRWWYSHLVTCRMCLTPWTALALCLCSVVPAYYIGVSSFNAFLLRLPIYVLASAGLAFSLDDWRNALTLNAADKLVQTYPTEEEEEEYGGVWVIYNPATNETLGNFSSREEAEEAIDPRMPDAYPRHVS